jgi:WD40 repeat protein/serine/threonine protein kinase
LRSLHTSYLTEIFEVEDTVEQSTKVLKVLSRHNAKLIELFQREADVLHRLDHPGIPKVDAIGCFTVPLRQREHPLHCLVMEKIAGENLQQWLTHHGAIHQSLALVWLRQLVEILDQIHQNQLLHRDIKPSNIMLRPCEPWGQLVLIDFGTAREITETVIEGRDSTVVYSDGYTAPEQIRGRATAQSDFFALGRTFIHLLTHMHPNEFAEDATTHALLWEHRAPQIAPYFTQLIRALAADNPGDRPADSREVLQQVMQVQAVLEPNLPFADNPPTPMPPVVLPALDWVTMMPIDFEGITRPDVSQINTYLQTNTAIRADVTQAEVVTEKTILDRLPAWLLRSWVVGSVVGGMAIALILVGFGLRGWQASSQRQQMILAQSLLTEAEQQQQQPGASLEQSMALALEAWKRLKAAGLPTLSVEQFLQAGLTQLPQRGMTVTHPNDVMAIALSSDGAYLATASADRRADVWDLTTQEELYHFEHGARVNDVAFSPNGAWVATASQDHTVQLQGMGEAANPRILQHDAAVSQVRFTADSRYLVTVSLQTVRVWDLESQTVAYQRVFPAMISAIALSPQSTQMAIATMEGQVTLWTPGEDENSVTVSHTDSVNAVAFSPDGRYIATASQDQTAVVWEVATGKSMRVLSHSQSVMAIAFSPDGQRLLTGTGSPLPKLQPHTAQIWDWTNGKMLLQVTHAAGITQVAFSNDGRFIATASFDHTARVWDAKTGQPISQLIHNGAVMDVVFGRDRRILATASLDNTAQMWDLIGDPTLFMFNHPATVTHLAFGAQGDRVATSTADGAVWVWSQQTNALVQELIIDQPMRAIALSPDEAYLAVVSGDRTLQMWRIDPPEQLWELQHADTVNALVFSPDGAHVATASADNTARILETKTGLEVAQLQHDSFVEAIAFSPDGRYLATGSLDNTARIWEWQGTSPREVVRLGHDSFVEALAFSPDGRYLATASLDNNARVWDWQRNSQMPRLTLLHDQDVRAIAFSADGHYLAALSQDNLTQTPQNTAVLVWSVPDGRNVMSIEDPSLLSMAGFSPFGNYLATVSRDHGVQVWSVESQKEVARLNPSGEVPDLAFSSQRHQLGIAAGQQALVWDWDAQDLITAVCDRLHYPLTLEQWQRFLKDEPYRPMCGDRPRS